MIDFDSWMRPAARAAREVPRPVRLRRLVLLAARHLLPVGLALNRAALRRLARLADRF